MYTYYMLHIIIWQSLHTITSLDVLGIFTYAYLQYVLRVYIYNIHNIYIHMFSSFPRVRSLSAIIHCVAILCSLRKCAENFPRHPKGTTAKKKIVHYWLVVLTILKNMKFNGKDYFSFHFAMLCCCTWSCKRKTAVTTCHHHEGLSHIWNGK